MAYFGRPSRIKPLQILTCVTSVCTEPPPRVYNLSVILPRFNERPSWETIPFRRAESESGIDVQTLLLEKRADHRVTGVGARKQLTTTTMNNQQFSLANRKQFADMLADDYNGLRSKVKRQFRQKVELLQKALVNEYAEKKGALKLVAQIDAARLKVRELSAELAELGFEIDGKDLRLSNPASNPLDRIIDQRIEKDLGSNDAIDARFDSAQLAMMTIASLEDAEKLLKSVSEV